VHNGRSNGRLRNGGRNIKIPTGSGGQALNLATISGGKFFVLPL
jgi:hypothetical protein